MPGEHEQRASLARDIFQKLRSHGHQAYLVGGCVRDSLLGIIPKDYDVSTDATPDETASYFPGSQLVGAHFGVVLVTRGPGVQVEVASFRSEGNYSDGRRPDRVEFERDPSLDAQRRDFTVNGLMQDPFSGQIFDWVGGRADLENRLIRAIGDPRKRFQEDRLRMLRAVRFAARLGFEVEHGTMAALQELAPAVVTLSPERVRDELIRILTEGHARRGFKLLDESGLLRHVLPEVEAMKGVQQPPEFHPEGDVWVHVLMILENLRNPSPTLAVGALLHDVGKPATFRIADRIRFDGHAEVGARMAAEIASRLRFSSYDSGQIVSLVANHMRFKDVQQMRPSTLKRFLGLPNFQEHLELHRLDCLCSNGYTDAYNFVESKLEEFGEAELKPARLVNGKDLLAIGFKPGPALGEALTVIETAQLDGSIRGREEALALAGKLLNAPNPIEQ